jgi:hypothetical protein
MRRWFALSTWVRYLVMFAAGSVFAAAIWQPQFWAYWRAEAEQEIEAHETRVVQQVRAGQAESRKAAERAVEDKRNRPKPVTITRKYRPPSKYKPPREAMAGRTQVTMGETWGGTLEVNNEPDVIDASSWVPVTTSVSVSALGCSVSVDWDGNDPYLGALVSEERWAAYQRYIVTASAPGDTDTADVYVRVGDLTATTSPPLPTGATTVDNLSVGFQLSTQGIYLKRSRTATSYPTRNTMDWSDLSSIDLWYADDTSTVTVTTTGDVALSATGSLGYTPGQEVEIGTSYILSASITETWFPSANTTYGRISGINWGGTAVSLSNLPVYNPGDPAGIPSADISPWSRIWTTNDALAIVDDSGMAMQRLTALAWWPGQSYTGTLKWSAPKILTLTAVDRMFANPHDQYSPRIEYTSVPITWTSTTENEPTPFTDTINVAEYPTNFEYLYEYQKISGNTVSVRVTDLFRTAQGEDVGGDTEQYNDQLCGIALPPIDATDCISTPWWLSGVGVTHEPALDVNDTEGQAKRASVWLGGAGVETDPADNDKWLVAAGAIAPAVSRSFRSRCFLRWERLAELKNDPTAEHNADWPIMLKANLAIGTTLDDADWWTEPTLEVAGAGSGVNGTYSELNAYGGQQQYEHSGSYVRYDRATSRWIITDATATVYYHCATLEGTWEVDAGTGPAPTVALDWPEEYGYYSCAIEDIYNWANYSYVSLGMYAPFAGTATLSVTYRVPWFADPCYTGFEYRFGEWGEWEYGYSTYTLTWDIELDAGTATYLIDLACNNEGAIPANAYRMQVVQSVTITLPDNATGGDQQFVLNSLELVEDPGEPGRAEPDTHLVARFKPSWSWIDPNWADDGEGVEHTAENWFGFGGFNDGLPVLQVDTGYNTSFGKTGQELGLLYIQFAQHNPFSEATGRIDTAKSLGRWHNELSYQEGFTTTWPSNPAEGAHNQDADDGQVDANLYWWDLQQSDETVDWTDAPLALCTGDHTIAAGVAYDLRFYKYPRGVVHGIKRQTVLGVTTRVRDEADAVEFYGSDDDGATWALLEQPDTDEHGRWKCIPVREKDWVYRVATDGTTREVINREYTLDGVDVVAAFDWEGYLDLDECGVTWLVAVGQGVLRVYWIGAGSSTTRHEVTQPTTVDGHSRPSIAVAAGALYVAATLGSDMVIYRSLDRGETWAQLATDLGDGLTLGTIAWRETGEVMLCGVDTSDDIVLRMASDGYLTRDDLTAGVDEITIAASAAGKRSCVVRQSDGSILAAVEGSGQVDLYRCRDFGTGFAAV